MQKALDRPHVLARVRVKALHCLVVDAVHFQWSGRGRGGREGENKRDSSPESLRARTSLWPYMQGTRNVVESKRSLDTLSRPQQQQPASLTWGQGLPGARVSGGCGSSSRFTSDVHPWRSDVPMQSVPVSPPPITTTRLPLAEM